MNQLVVRHRYASGSAFDLSRCGNHGRPEAASWVEGGLRCDGRHARVVVPPSPTLTRLGSIRMQLSFVHHPVRAIYRQNLIEGHLSFAVYITEDQALEATIFDASGRWVALTSPPGVVIKDRWHTGQLVHDGAGQALLALDGDVLAQGRGLPGSVGGIQDFGLSVGRWPNPEPRDAFEGVIGEVRLWRYDPRDAIRDLLDACCVDKKRLQEVVAQLRADGWDAERASELFWTLYDAAARAAHAHAGSDTGELARAVRTGSRTSLLRGLATLMRSKRSRHDRAHGDAILDVLAKAPFGSELVEPLRTGRPPDDAALRRLAAALCLEELLPARRDVRKGH